MVIVSVSAEFDGKTEVRDSKKKVTALTCLWLPCQDTSLASCLDATVALNKRSEISHSVATFIISSRKNSLSKQEFY